MWNIIKSEMDYYSSHLLLAAGLMFIYTLVVVFDIPYLNEETNLSKVIWPILTGAVPIFIIALTFIKRVKENRVRILLTLPFRPIDIAKSDRLMGLILSGFVLFYFVLVHMIILDQWGAITKRLIYMIGLYLIIFSIAKVSYEMMLSIRFKRGISFVLSAIAFAFFMILGIFIGDNILFPILYQAHIGIIYSFVGLSLFYIGTKMFENRHDYTR